MAKLYFYYSTMNAGKSTSLLQSSHNYRERGMRTLVYTAQFDQLGGGRVHSRIGLSSDARHFAAGSETVAIRPRPQAGVPAPARPKACLSQSDASSRAWLLTSAMDMASMKLWEAPR